MLLFLMVMVMVMVMMIIIYFCCTYWYPYLGWLPNLKPLQEPFDSRGCFVWIQIVYLHDNILNTSLLSQLFTYRYYLHPHTCAFYLGGGVGGRNLSKGVIGFQFNSHSTAIIVLAEEYVTCHTCRSPDTLLQKETRLFFLQCETCGSRRSVASIKSGFQALTQKRAQLKNKQQ